MRTQFGDYLSFEAADGSQEANDLPEIVAYHAKLMQGGPGGAPGSDTYAESFRAIIKDCPLDVIVDTTYRQVVSTGITDDRAKVHINPNHVDPRPADGPAGNDDRASRSRYGLMFGVGHQALLRKQARLRGAAEKQEFSAYLPLSPHQEEILKDILTKNPDRNRLVFLRELMHLNYDAIVNANQMDQEMVQKGLDVSSNSNYRANRRWNSFDHFLSISPSRENDMFLKTYDTIIANHQERSSESRAPAAQPSVPGRRTDLSYILGPTSPYAPSEAEGSSPSIASSSATQVAPHRQDRPPERGAAQNDIPPARQREGYERSPHEGPEIEEGKGRTRGAAL